MKAGILGGSFDPVHNGHLITSTILREQRALDKIILVPCFISPHKQDKNYTDAFHRIKMLELAVKNKRFYEICDFEIRKGGISYTYDTLIHLKAKYDDLELIIGMDNFKVFSRWKYPEKIIELVNIVVMERKSDQSDLKALPFYHDVRFTNTPRIDISSSNIRERLKSNFSIDYFVPEDVNNYIIRNNLYR